MPPWYLLRSSRSRRAKRNNSSRKRYLLIENQPSGDKKDLDATWTKKNGKNHYDYKLSANMDKKYKFIRKIVTDTASTHDSQHFERVIDKANTNRNIYADRGYPSAEREAWLKANGYRSQIQRKGHRNKPLSKNQQGRNHQIAGHLEKPRRLHFLFLKTLVYCSIWVFCEHIKYKKQTISFGPDLISRRDLPNMRFFEVPCKE